MDELLRELLDRLQTIGDRDESLYDTAVREVMGDAIFYGFLKPSPGYALPDDYGMPEDKNKLIKAALQSYIKRANDLAPALELDTFHKRLEAFQDLSIVSSQGIDYDEFFGWTDPDAYDDSGNFIRRH